jgi:CubicO group peptidase (beta-lactamase class C family)
VTTPDTPELEPAGSQVAYNDHDVHLLGRILATRIARESLKDLFKRRIADPIGMSRWDWGVCGTVDGMVHYNAAGTPTLKGNGGIHTTPRELARLGHLYLNRGRWKDKQLLSASFVNEASTTQVPAALPGRSSSLLSGAYGFYWWTNGVMANGKRRWPAAPPKTYAAHGACANFCFVIPEWNMVLVRMGNSDLPGGSVQQDQLWNSFFAKMADALGSAP